VSALIEGPETRMVLVNGRGCRVWRKGAGRRVFWLPSAPMALRWGGFAEALAAGAAVSACALPGFAGSAGHDELDDHLAWCLAARDLLAGAGFERGDTLIGSSSAGALAADVAALWPEWIGRLVLLAPHGLYDAAEPPRDMFALHPRAASSLLAAEAERHAAQIKPPEDAQPVLWSIGVVRGNEAAARFLWPLGDTRLGRRLHRIAAPTLVLWGEADRIIPPSYAGRFTRAIGGHATARLVPGAGHLLELDRPDEVAALVRDFVA
jgi:pimeloyl-ACP methyl ester carboxylesterase